MQGRGRAPLVRVSVAAHGVGSEQHLDVDPATLQLLDHGARRPQPAVRAGAEDELLGKLVLDIAEVLDRERVALVPPPVREDAIGQHDQVARLLLTIDDDPPEAVVLQTGHAEALGGRAGLRPRPLAVRTLSTSLALDRPRGRPLALTLGEHRPKLLAESRLT